MSGRGFTAGPDEDGLRLDAALAARGLSRSRSEAQRVIERGEVTVDGSARPKNHRLAAGEVVELHAADERRADDSPVPFEIVHEDEHLLVVDKPAGVVVHPAGGRREPSLAGALAGVAPRPLMPLLPMLGEIAPDFDEVLRAHRGRTALEF